MSLKKPEHNPMWTIGGAVLVLNNVINWKHHTRHTSRLAREHPLCTVLMLAAYAYHFLWPEKDAEVPPGGMVIIDNSGVTSVRGMGSKVG